MIRAWIRRQPWFVTVYVDGPPIWSKAEPAEGGGYWVPVSWHLRCQIFGIEFPRWVALLFGCK